MRIKVKNKNTKKLKKKTQKPRNPETQATQSELRYDLVTGDWVVIATGRGKRPDDFVKKEEEKNKSKNKDKELQECLFEDPEKTGQEKDTLIYKDHKGDWTLRVFPNKYPAFSPTNNMKQSENGPYVSLNGIGHHEIVVPRDHYHNYALMKKYELAEVIDAYQDRYLDLMQKRYVNYISIFHNHGPRAGASILHPHSQLMAIPIVSPYIKLELNGSEDYFQNTGYCVYCAMIEWEVEQKIRVVFENDYFLAYCPFASRANFEIWVLPKYHDPYFERTNDAGKVYLAEVLGKALLSLHKGLKNPDYNFYLHTGPCDGDDYYYFHWHIEIIPRLSTWAGFELQTGIEISTMEPEESAEFLRKQLKD